MKRQRQRHRKRYPRLRLVPALPTNDDDTVPEHLYLASGSAVRLPEGIAGEPAIDAMPTFAEGIAPGEGERHLRALAESKGEDV